MKKTQLTKTRGLKKRTLCLIALAAFWLLPTLAAGEGGATLSGRITDPSGGNVPSVTVRLYGRNTNAAFAAESDADGQYRFTNIPAGEYLLEGEDPTSTLGTSEKLTVAAGEARSHDIELRVRGVRTEVLVTASSTPLSMQEVAKASDVVDGDQISRRAEYSIAEALRTVPGVRVRQHRGPGSLTTIQTRGMRDYDTALLIDGLRFRDAAGTQGDATPFHQDMLVVDSDRIEFLRGSGSSLYGSHAMGGMINIVSNQGGGRTHGEISAEGGGLGFTRGVARVGGGLGSVDQFVYSGGIAHLNVIEGIDGFDPYRNTSGQGYARYQFTPSISLSGRAYGGDSFGALNESPTFDDAVIANHPLSGPVRAIGLPVNERRKFENEQPFDAGQATFIQDFNDPDNHRAGSFFAGSLIFQHELSPTSSYRVSYHGVDTNRSFRDGPAGRSFFDPDFSNDGRFDGRTDTLQARTDQRLGENHLVTIGYEYEREEYLNVNTDENPEVALRDDSSGQIKQDGHSVFAQDQLRLFDGRLQLGVSGRVQTFRLTEPVFSGDSNPYRASQLSAPKTALTGDGAIAYFFRSSGTKVRAHVGNAYRAPSSFERLGATFFAGFASFWGDPGLRPECSVALDAGIDQWLWGSRLRLSGSYFYTALQEIILFDFGIIDAATDPFGRFGGYRNTGGGLTRGGEFSASLAPTAGLNILASYTYTNSASRRPTISSEAFFKTLGVSDHMFSMTATQRIGQRFDVTFDLFAASGYPLQLFGADRRLAFDGPIRADLVASYSFPVGEGRELRLYGKAENVFDRTYYENAFAAPGLWGIGGLKFQF